MSVRAALRKNAKINALDLLKRRLHPRLGSMFSKVLSRLM
jgi:hypothetical protein